jgi:type VI secretion system protein ImpA
VLPRKLAELSVMTVWNPDELRQPLSGDQPGGEDLEYSPLLAGFDAYRLFGQATPAEEPPDWGEIRTRAIEALERTRDLRLLAHVSAAVLRTDGLAAFADTLGIAADWLEGMWGHVYPLAPDDDVMMRRNALSAFADPMAIVEGLRRLPLVSGRHGTITLRDIDIATGAVAPGEKDTKLDEAQIEAAFADVADADLATVHDAAARAVGGLDRIEKATLAGGGIEAVPDLSRLRPVVVRIERLFRQHVEVRQGTPATGETGTIGAAEPTAVAIGSIKSRQDAIRALDAVAEYFRRNEPSSPIPLFVDRAKRLVAKDFLEVLADIAPDALAQARAAGGVPQAE